MPTSNEIRNRVAESPLVTIDLEAIYPSGERVLLDIAAWLYEGQVLREKEFRGQLDAQDWERYSGTYVAVTCSTDAIVPGWAYPLIASKLCPHAILSIYGDLEALETAIFQPIVENLDLSAYHDRPVILKGCGGKPVPTTAYMLIVNRLQPIVKSLMYGEACSSVPLYKRK